MGAGSTQQHWPFPKGKEETGYAYLLTHPGIPCIMWEHYFDDGKKGIIDKLINVRWDTCYAQCKLHLPCCRRYPRC